MKSRTKTFRPCMEILEDRTVPSAGALDPSFGVGGLVITQNTTRMVASPNSAWAVQVDEKIVVAGESAKYSEGLPDFAVARYNLDGTLDTSFGRKGWITVDFGSSRDVAVAVAVQPDGRIVVAGYSNVNATDPSADDGYDFALARLNADGSLDTSFGSDGKQTIDFGTDQDLAHAVALQSDGKIVVSGNRFIPGLGYGFAVARLNSDGTTDDSFGDDGKQFVDFGSSYDYNTDLALQPDGKVVLAGTTSNRATRYDFAVARLNADGSLDTSFGSDGRQSIDLAGNYDIGAAVAVLPDGTIVVSGTSLTDAGGFDFAVARLNMDGSLDTSFGSDGWQTVDLGSSDDSAQDMVVQPDGKIVVAGYTFVEDLDTIYDFAVVRLNADGSVDDSFDGDGKQIINIAWEDYGRGVALEPDGKIVVVGTNTVFETEHADFELARLNADGSLDSTFGRGWVQTDFPRRPAPGALSSVGIQPDGKIVALAGAYEEFPVVVRYNVDGTIDTTFGTNGFARLPLNFVLSGWSTYLAVQRDGKIVLAQSGVVARLNADGSLDTTFGNGGIKGILTGFDIYAVVPTQHGKIVVAGGILGEDSDFGVVQLNADGSLDTTFDGDGIQTIDFGGYESVFGVAVEPGGEIVVAGNTLTFIPGIGSTSDIAVARLKKDGSLDRSFNGDGKLTFDFGAPGAPLVYDVAVQQNGKVVVFGGDGFDFYVARLNKDGSLDRSFDADGKQIIDFGGYDRATSMALQPDDKIVLAGYTDVGAILDFAVARLNQDGSLDTSFGDDGKQIMDFGAGIDIAYDVVLQRDGKIVVVGGAGNPVTGSDFALVRLLGRDEERSPKISISEVKKREGHLGQTTLFTFTVKLAAAYDQPVTISFRTVDGTATTSDQDYVAKIGTLTFAPGETTKTITIEVKGDSKKEADETFYLELFGNSSNSLFNWTRGIGTILNDD